MGINAAAGKNNAEVTPEPLTYEQMRPGCYDPVARLGDMDQAGVLASLSFPSFPRFCGQIFLEASDKDLALLCVRAYNDWMIEEWCGAAPNRYIPLIIVPLWDPREAGREVERCAAMGARAVAFSENPEPLGLPTIHDHQRYWDPLMCAAAEAELVVCMHVGSSSRVPKISADAPFLANLSWGASRTSAAMLSWLFSGYFQRLPELKIALSEGEIGWIPFFLERAEQVLQKQAHWVARGFKFSDATGDHGGIDFKLDEMDIRQLYHDHVFGCFIDDVHGLKNLDAIGEDNVMIEVDYPHQDTTWPHSLELARARTGDLSPEVRLKIFRRNAERVFRFEQPSAA
jgi:predicted TIM-barrel fold metal-dependent hydrolase